MSLRALFIFGNFYTAHNEGGGNMKGWYEGYSYCGIMPDGRLQRFATDTEYREAYAEEAGLSYIF